MYKTELIEQTAYITNLSKKDVASVLNTALGIIETTVSEGSDVSLAGFGIFESRISAPTIRVNPRTLAKVDVPAKRFIKFRPLKRFKQLVLQDRRVK